MERVLVPIKKRKGVVASDLREGIPIADRWVMITIGICLGEITVLVNKHFLEILLGHYGGRARVPASGPENQLNGPVIHWFLGESISLKSTKKKGRGFDKVVRRTVIGSRFMELEQLNEDRIN